MDLKDFYVPFPAEDVEWRVQQAGEKNDRVWAMVLAYITNRAIMERLDEVCGQENWRNEYKEGPQGGVLCGISIKVKEEWVTKWDGAENTNIEQVKGGLSDAMKRAGYQWGIGRYLYKLESTFAKVHSGGKRSGKCANKKTGKDIWFKWDPPQLPVPAEASPPDAYSLVEPAEASTRPWTRGSRRSRTMRRRRSR